MSHLSPRNLLLMYVGALCGTGLLLTAYVSFAESTPDPSFRHMAPARFYVFIPFFALWALAAGVLAEVFWFQRKVRPVGPSFGWLFLGLAYSLVWLNFGLAGTLQSGAVLPLSYLGAFLCSYLAHLIFASRNASAA